MRVLFIEDSELFLYFRETFFARIGWQIWNARNGKSGIARIREDRPDLVVLSDELPDMPGIEVCRRIRSVGPEKPPSVIVLLDGISGSKIREYTQIGCDDYVLRPVEPGVLMERISRILRVAYRRGPRLLVIMETVASNSHSQIFGNIINLSETGLFVETNDAVEPGTILDVELKLPGGKDAIVIKGKVARLHRLAGKVQYGLGVQFQEMASRTREAILSYIERELQVSSAVA